LPALLAVIGGSPRDGVWLIRALIAAAAFAHSRQGEVARVHAHFAHRPADVARMFALLQGVPWSVSVHAWDVFAQAPTALRRRIAGSERIFACTRVAQEHLTRLLPEITARFALMYHGIDATQLPPESCPGEVVLAVGRLERKKGFDLLVEAARILRDAGDLISVVIVGDGPERGALEGAIARHALEGQVALVGSRSQASLMRFYAQAAVVVVPSRQLGSGDRDGLPNVILEALGSARPVVATAVGGIPEVVVDGRNGFLVPPDDPAALADAIRHILTNRDDARRLGLAGAALVRSDFDSRRTVRTLCEYFEGDVHPTSA
ncbi:MAG: glycosyltransferase, partial [Isosphaeraceae bacterium]|nr:glycosyltransferase [Isosphaeraceae bacterium]